jgi:long-subunit acyl-CoA synthetase (AMP-forming)
VVEPDALGAWAALHDLAGSSPEHLAGEPQLLAEIGRAVQRANAKLARVEQIKRWRLLGSEWLPGGDELTPTMKLRRAQIARKYESEIEQLYSEG